MTSKRFFNLALYEDRNYKCKYPQLLLCLLIICFGYKSIFIIIISYKIYSQHLCFVSFILILFKPNLSKSMTFFHPVVESQAKMITINGHALLKERPCLQYLYHGPYKILSFSDKWRIFLFHKVFILSTQKSHISLDKKNCH